MLHHPLPLPYSQHPRPCSCLTPPIYPPPRRCRAHSRLVTTPCAQFSILHTPPTSNSRASTHTAPAPLGLVCPATHHPLCIFPPSFTPTYCQSPASTHTAPLSQVQQALPLTTPCVRSSVVLRLPFMMRSMICSTQGFSQPAVVAAATAESAANTRHRGCGVA